MSERGEMYLSVVLCTEIPYHYIKCSRSFFRFMVLWIFEKGNIGLAHLTFLMIPEGGEMCLHNVLCEEISYNQTKWLGTFLRHFTAKESSKSRFLLHFQCS